VRYAGIANGFEQTAPVVHDAWLDLPGWQILYGTNRPESKIARASLEKMLQNLPEMLSGLL
jgi:hypothetical protein